LTIQASRRGMDAAIAVAHPRLADFLGPAFQRACGGRRAGSDSLRDPPRGRPGPLDRHAPFPADLVNQLALPRRLRRFWRTASRSISLSRLRSAASLRSRPCSLLSRFGRLTNPSPAFRIAKGKSAQLQIELGRDTTLSSGSINRPDVTRRRLHVQRSLEPFYGSP
jgi:hypothetical protein